MKNLTLYTSLLVVGLLAIPAHALQQQGVRQTSPTKTLKLAQKEGLGISKSEINTKKQLTKLKKKNKKSFNALKDDKLSNPDYYNSYINELEGKTSQIEKAKVIARYTLLEAARSNKERLMQSTFNEHAFEDWKAVEFHVKRDLNKNTLYVPGRDKNSKNYTFETSGWGRVTVASNLRSAKWMMDVSSALDDNKLEPGADKIRIQDESYPGFDEQDFEQPEVPVPALATGDRRSIVPQIKPQDMKK